MKENIKVQCGDDIFNISQIKITSIVDSSCNFDLSLKENIEQVLNKYWHEFGYVLPSPHKKFSVSSESHFSMGSFDKNGEAIVKWNFQWKTGDWYNCGEDTVELSFVNEIIPAFEKLINIKPKTNKQRRTRTALEVVDVALFLVGGTESASDAILGENVEITSDTKKELSSVYNQYMQEREKKGKSALRVYFHNWSYKEYIETLCGFDIFEKSKEIESILEEIFQEQEKKRNSNNRGEKDVEYNLKWITKSIDAHVVAIESDCESEYRYNCILLRNSSFVDEMQEYDHILVTPAGVVLIETKDWKGNITVTSDGKWIRYKEDGSPYGTASPISQMRRHEQLMESILPSVPVYSVLCFSNPSAIINGKEHIKNYPIINIEQLEDELKSICSHKKFSDTEIDSMVETIESYKVNRM